MINYIIGIILILIFVYILYKSKILKKNEKIVSPGYSNRVSIDVEIDNTYGGTDLVNKDPRFGA